MAKFYSSDLPEYQVEPESFEFVQMEGEIADEKFQDKPIGFFKDAMLCLPRPSAAGTTTTRI